MTQRFDNTDKCPECGCSKIVHSYERGESACSKCGLVIETLSFADGIDAMKYDSEGNCQNNKDGRHRLGSSIGYGRNMPGRSRAKMARLRIIQKRMTAGSERALKSAQAELGKMCSVNHLPETVQEYAENVYMMAARKKLIKGRTVRHVLAVGIYEGCINLGYPRTLDAVSEMCGVGRKELARDVRLLSRMLKLKKGLTGAANYVGPMSNGLGLNNETVSLAKRFANDANDKQIMSGKSPASIAAAALYLASDKMKCKIPQTLIAKVTGISCPTIKRVTSDLEKCLAV